MLAITPRAAKDRALRRRRRRSARRDEILAGQCRGPGGRARAGCAASLLDRLALDGKRVEAWPRASTVAALADPVGTELARWTRPNGLDIARVRVPLGVVGIIYESRPNVTADAGALCLKAGNAAILRGGSESFHSSRAIVAALAGGPRAAGLPEAAIQLRADRRPGRGRHPAAHGRADRRHRAARRAAR